MGQVCIAMLNYQRASLISVAEGLNHQPWPYFRGKHAPHAAPLPTGTADDRCGRGWEIPYKWIQMEVSFAGKINGNHL